MTGQDQRAPALGAVSRADTIRQLLAVPGARQDRTLNADGVTAVDLPGGSWAMVGSSGAVTLMLTQLPGPSAAALLAALPRVWAAPDGKPEA